MSESDQGQPTGGQAKSVEATSIGPSWIEVSGRAGCEVAERCVTISKMLLGCCGRSE